MEEWATEEGVARVEVVVEVKMAQVAEMMASGLVVDTEMVAVATAVVEAPSAWEKR